MNDVESEYDWEWEQVYYAQWRGPGGGGESHVCRGEPAHAGGAPVCLPPCMRRNAASLAEHQAVCKRVKGGQHGAVEAAPSKEAT